MNESLEPDSNVTVERDAHFAKQCLPIRSTVEGMQIDVSDEQFENAEWSIHESFGPDSNATVDREEQLPKQ
jgi:hypothetical protein